MADRLMFGVCVPQGDTRIGNVHLVHLFMGNQVTRGMTGTWSCY